jgi:fido (protein-threonine AMPylation protein)
MQAKDWERIVSLGVSEGISSRELYIKAVGRGMRFASLLKQNPIPSAQGLKELHAFIFLSVHPWAGTFRKPGQEVQAGRCICSLAKDIPLELQELNKEMLSHPMKGTKKFMSEVLGFYHVSLVTIHPFLDGNGRVSRVILDKQCKELLGHGFQTGFSREQYIEALNHARETGNLGQIAKIVRGEGLKKSLSKGGRDRFLDGDYLGMGRGGRKGR